MNFSELGGFVRQHSTVVGAVAGGSLVFLVACAALGPFMLARLPTDYFAPAAMSRRLARKRSLPVKLARNFAGIVLCFVGGLLLVLPGQGLLTILVGLMLLDFPAKKQLMARVLQREGARVALDWLRRRVGKEPFRWE